MADLQVPPPDVSEAPGARRSDHGKIIRQAAEALILFGAVLAAYGPALRGGILWDDLAHLTPLALRSLHGLWRIWFELGATAQYYPLLHTAFWTESHLWGSATLGYHLWNITLHAAAAFLVVRIVRRLRLPGAWLAGFVFALHPVCVEAVAWMSEQKSTLSAVFYLGSALTYLEFHESGRKRRYWIALGLFVLALLSKSVTATLPAVLLVIFWWQKGRLDWKRDIRPLSGWLVLGLGSGIFTAWVERKFIGAEGAIYALSAVQHILLAGRVFWFYAAKLFWPSNLMFSYPHWNLNPTEWWQYLFPAGLLAIAAAFAILARWNRGPLAALLIYVGTLTPVLGFLNVYPFRYSYVADHFQYLATLAIIVPVCCLLVHLARRAVVARSYRAAFAILLVLGLGFLTWRQAHIYTDSETLYRATLERNPASFMAMQNLCATLLADPDRLADAAAPCEASVALRPDLATPHVNMGVLKKNSGSLAEAMNEWRTAIRLDPRDADAHYDLGNVLADNGRIAEAIPEFEAALRVQPQNPQFYLSYGAALRSIPGREQDSLHAFRNALSIFPCYPDAFYGEGLTFLQIPGRHLDALDDFEKTLQCEPKYQPAREILARQFTEGR